MLLDVRFQKDPAMVSRNVAGEVILVPIRANVNDLESIFTLNETAASAWELFDGKHTLEEISRLLAEEYDASPEDIQQDLFELVEQLERIGALVRI